MSMMTFRIIIKALKNALQANFKYLQLYIIFVYYL